MPRPALLTALLVLILGAGLAFLFLVAPREEAGGVASVVERPSFTGYDAEAAPSWTLRAARGTLNGETGTFEDVEIVFHAEAGSDLTARGRTFTFNGEDGTLSGEVRVERGDGYRLEGESLTFREAAGEVTAGPVVIHAQAGTVEATNLTYEVRTGRSLVSGGFTAVVDRPALRICGETAEEAEGRLSLTGNLEVEREGETWRAERVDVEEEDRTVTLVGNVEGALSEGRVSASSLTLDPDGDVTASGVRLALDRRFFTEDHGP